jgi:hypothetical protein
MQWHSMRSCYTMITEMSGEITLENLSPDRHWSNWELAIAEDQNEVSYKLRQAHDMAFLELTGGMGMAFDPTTKKAIVKPSIAAKAGLGPYEFEVKADGPNHYSSTLKLEALSGRLEEQGRIFKFTASVVIKVDVTLHPLPKGIPDITLEPRQQQTSESTQTASSSQNNDGLLKYFGIAAAIVVGIVLCWAGHMTAKSMEPSLPRLQTDPAMGGSLYLHRIYPNGIPDA